jgi:hypothetical protein
MTTTLQQFPDSEFPTIHCTRRVVNPDTTNLKWNPANKHPGISVLGQIDTARTLSPGGERGIISSTGYIIGTDVKSWYFLINEAVEMYFGLVENTQDMTSIIGAAYDTKLNVFKNDRVKFSLSGSAIVTIRQESSAGGARKIIVADLTEHAGKVLYPWVSTTADETMSVKILEDVDFAITVRGDGKVVMTGTNNDIVDFNLGDIAENSGVSGGTIASDKIQNTTSGAYVETKDDGGIVFSGGERHDCTKVTTPVITLNLSLDQNVIVVSNPITTSVVLPLANAVSECMAYSIVRNYPFQVGETWQNPALKVYGNGTDTIDGEAWIGLQPDTSMRVISYDINKWRIM